MSGTLLRNVGGMSIVVMDTDQRRAHGRPERPEIDDDDVAAALADYLYDCARRWMTDPDVCGLPGVGADYVLGGADGVF